MEETKGQFETDAQSIVSGENETTQSSEEQGDSEIAVKYSTHKKLLNQHKNVKSELEDLRAFKQKVEEEESMKKGEFDKIIKARDERIHELSSKLENIDKGMRDSRKYQAFNDLLPGKIKKDEYAAFIDLDGIGTTDDGQIDRVSLEQSVNKFVKEFPDLIQLSSGKSLPNVNSVGGSTPNTKKSLKNMTREELKAAYISGQFKH